MSKVNILTIGASAIIGCAATLAFQATPGLLKAEAAEKATVAMADVWRAETLETMALEKLPDIDWSPVESGTKQNSEVTLFEGDNVVVVWEAGPAKLLIDQPFPYDEFVVVLKGQLVLTDKAGTATTYDKGDIFMVPKGFEGTWDMTEEYRELIVVDRDAYYADE